MTKPLHHAIIGLFFIAVLASQAVRLSAASQPQTLVKDGKAQSVIIVPSAPNEAAIFAAGELQLHLKKVTGADVPILSDRAAAAKDLPAGTISILVGESLATQKLGLTTRDFKRQDYSLKFLENSVVLMGWDATKYPLEKGGASFKFGEGRFGGAIVDGWASIGVREHGFNDERGTMECFIYNPKKDTKSSGEGEGITGGAIFKIGDEKSMHELRAKGELSYETRVNGQSHVITYRNYPSLSVGWHHLMCTWDAQSKKAEMYIDGKLVGSGPYAKTDAAKAERFGVRGGSDLVPYTWGRLDEVRLSNVVRPVAVPVKPYETDDKTLLLLHLDKNIDDFPYDSSEYPRKSPKADPGSGDNVATLYAVYDFIEEYLGVRWYFPGDNGMVYDQKKTLSVTGQDVRRRPAMECRSGVADLIRPADADWGGEIQQKLFDNADDEAIRLYSRRQRTGGRPLASNHAFYGYTDRFAIWKANPKDARLKDYEDDVKMFEKGTFMAQGYGAPSQLCYSSQDTVDYLVKEARRYFDGNGAKAGANAGPDFFAIVPNDDCYWCKCKNCQAQLMYPGTESGNNVPDYSLGGESNASFYIWEFTRRVAVELQKSHPDKYVAQLAYIQYFGFPMTKDGKQMVLPSNILLGLCLSTRPFPEFDPKRNGEQREYVTWMKYARANRWKTTFWLYDCFPNETGSKRFYNYNWWPGFHGRNLVKSKQMFIKDGVEGLFLCGVSDYIDAWLTWKAMDKADLDADKALDEFFTRYYGPAAKPMQAFYAGVETAFTDFHRRYGVQEYGNWSAIGTPPSMKEAEKNITAARQLAKDEPWKKRVGLVDVAVWQHMQKGYGTWTAKQAGGKHTWPFVLGDGKKFQSDERGNTPPGLNFLKSVYFRDAANPIGLRDHRFNDQAGTMEAWVWCGPLKKEYRQGPGTIFEIVSPNGETGQTVYISEKNGVLQAVYATWADGKTNQVVANNLAPNQWHHVMAVWLATAAKPVMGLYIDYKPIGSAPYTPTRCSTALAFGVAGPGAPIPRLPTKGNGFGPIDEVRLSNVIRKPIRQTAPHKTDPNTLLLLHFDEPKDAVIKDYSGIER